MQLSAQQMDAIASSEPRLIVRACPGAGKTTVLTEKLARMINEHPSERVAAVTFTRNAAEEMQARLVAKVGREAEGVRVGTIHSLCLEMIRKLSESRPRIADEKQRETALRAAAKAAGVKEKEAAAHITRTKAQGVFSDPLVEVYQEKLDGALDFDDILIQAWRLLAKDDGWRKRLPWRHFLVDEAQDLNPVQAMILGCLTSPKDATFFAVGDPDQAIYGFRGSDPEIFETLPGQRMDLDVNWRSGEVVVDRCAKLASAPFRPGRGIRGRLEWFEAASPEDEIRHLVELVKGEPRHKDVAVLARTNADARRIALALRGEGINILDKNNMLELDRYKGLAALLMVAANPKKASSREFLEAAAAACKYLRSHQFRRVIEQAAKEGVSPWEASKRNLPTRWMNARAAWFRAFMGKMIKVSMQTHDPQLVVREIVVNLKETEWAGLTPMDEDELSSLLRLTAKKKSLDDAARAIKKLAETKEDGVRVMTVHAAKGLEAPSVYVPFINRGSYPHGLAETPDEERRLLFVALTRAKERLAVSWSKENKSPFLDILGLPPVSKKRFLWFFTKKVEVSVGSEGQELHEILASRPKRKSRNEGRSVARRLLVCPWCGKKAKMVDGYSGHHWLECPCGCRWVINASAFGWRKCAPPKPSIMPETTSHIPSGDLVVANLDRALRKIDEKIALAA